MAAERLPSRDGQFSQASLEALSYDSNRRHFIDSCGFFGGRSFESVRAFIAKVDNEQKVTSVSSWNVAKIVSENLLREEAALAKQRWDRDKDNYQHVSFWNEQDEVPYRARVLYVPPTAPRAAVAPVGVPDTDGYIPGSPAVAFDPGQPELQPIREEPKVLPNKCLRTYLLQAFDKVMSQTAARQRFETYRMQPKNMSMRSFLNRLVIACKDYHSVKYTAEQREEQGYKEQEDKELLEIALAGCCGTFRRYFENYNTPLADQEKIKTFTGFEDLAVKWESGTEEGQDLQRKASSFKLVSATERQEEEEVGQGQQQDYDLRSSAAERGKGAPTGNFRRGGRPPPPGKGKGRASSADQANKGGTVQRSQQRPPGSNGSSTSFGQAPTPIVDPRYPDYWKNPPADIKTPGPLCFFCGCSGHGRPVCPHLRKAIKEGKDIPCAPNRGSIRSYNQRRRDRMVASIVAAQGQQLSPQPSQQQAEMQGAGLPPSPATALMQQAGRAIETMSYNQLTDLFRTASLNQAAQSQAVQQQLMHPMGQQVANPMAYPPAPASGYQHSVLSADSQSLASMPAYPQL